MELSPKPRLVALLTMGLVDQPMLVGLLLLSAVVHLAVWSVLGVLPSVEEALAQQLAPVTIEPFDPEPAAAPVEPEPEPEAEPEVEEPAPEPEPEPEPVVERERPTTPRPQPDPEPQAQPEPPPAEEAIADFTGETLTNDSGEAWASEVGNGAAMEGPIGQPGAQVTGRRREGVREGTPGGAGGAEEGPRVVAVSDLSRPPAPPVSRLRSLLSDNMPRRARDLGLEGNAIVRIRVNPDGRVQPLAVVREDQEGFGEACRRSIRASGRWEPPLDRDGQAVATITTFRCGFTINF